MKQFVYLLALVGSVAMAAPETKLEWLLQEFDRDPKTFMNKVPEKRSSAALTVKKFNAEMVESREFVTAKNSRRPLNGRAAFEGDDLASNLVDNGSRMVKSLAAMETKKLKSAKLKESPWSDYYWALYNGQLAYRYADEKYPGSESWKKNSDFILKNLVNYSSLENLSPAEKYDLLVGDNSKGLTHAALGEGEAYYKDQGKVETWMGICHGWAAAAYMLPRPRNVVKAIAADGKTKIPFFPSDIKALSSLLWAKVAPDSRFIGGRCNTKKPKEDKNGRINDSSCFDTNPGTWHLAVVNQIGVNKRSFVIDATYDYEVWNQPVHTYKYTYFNPQTLKEVSSLEDAMVEVSAFKKDKFKDYRSEKAKYVVGVNMEMGYVVETAPSTNKTDSPRNDEITTVEYQYDLELDARGNIIGGEWYNNAHPDFLWTPAEDDRAITSGDQFLASRAARDTWDGKEAMPKSWSQAAARTSEGEGAPLAVVVETLIDLSNNSLDIR